MTPEMQLAQVLGHTPKTKLASYMEERSIDELENILQVELEKTAASDETHDRANRGARHAATGAVAGGLGGIAADTARHPKIMGKGLKAMMKSKAGRRMLAKTVGKGALGGAALAGGIGLAARSSKEKKASVEERLDALLEKNANLVGTAMRGIMGSGLGQRAAVGAAGGAALGAGRYMMSNDPNKTFSGSVLGGAALGAGAGMAAKPALGALAKSSPGAAQYMRQSMGAAGKTPAGRAAAATKAQGRAAARAGKAAPAAPAVAAAPAAPAAAPVMAPGMTQAGATAQRIQHNVGTPQQGMLNRMVNGPTRQFTFAQPGASVAPVASTTGLAPAEVAMQAQREARLAARAQRMAKVASRLRKIKSSCR